MKKTLFLICAVLMAQTAFADSITDGIGTAGDAIYGYTPYVQYLGFIIAGIIGIFGAYSVYYAIANEAHDIKKRILRWGGGCVMMLCMSIALPHFFAYQESGLLASNGGGSGFEGYRTGFKFAGGDRYGSIINEIPQPDDPRWTPDPRFQSE